MWKALKVAFGVVLGAMLAYILVIALVAGGVLGSAFYLMDQAGQKQQPKQPAKRKAQQR